MERFSLPWYPINILILQIMHSLRSTLVRFLASLAVSAFVFFGAYLMLEPAMVAATGSSALDQVVVTLTVTEGISISSPADTTMSNALSTVINTAIGTTTWIVKTNAAGGYTMGITSSTSPAMQTLSGVVIPNFAAGGSGTTTAIPVTWSGNVVNTYMFGYSGFSTTTIGGVIPVNTTTWGSSATSCGLAGTYSTTLKYTMMATTTPITLATRTSTTTTAGDVIAVCYAVEQNGAYAPAGTYTATSTATATTL